MTSTDFFASIGEIQDTIVRTQGEVIQQTATKMADVIGAGDLVHLFGAGHSSLVVQEMFPRIGSFAGFNPIADLPLTRFVGVRGGGDMTHRANLFLSRIEEYGRIIFEDQDMRPSDLLLCSTATGINAVTVEVALRAKEAGITTVALTSVAHAMASDAAHSSGLRLHEACDITIDLCTPPGDAVVNVPGLNAPVGGTSTIAACMIGNALVVETAAILASRGTPPEIMPSVFYAGEQAQVRRAQAAESYERIWADSRRRSARI